MSEVCYSDLLRQASQQLTGAGQFVPKQSDAGYYSRRVLIAFRVAKAAEGVAELEALGTPFGISEGLSKAVGPRLAQAVRLWSRVPYRLDRADGWVTTLLAHRAYLEAIDADDADAEAARAAPDVATQAEGPPPMLTTEDVAARLNCSYGHARNLMLTGRLRHIRDGRMLRTTEEWLREYRDRQTVGEPSRRAGLAASAEGQRSPKPRRGRDSIPQGGIAASFLQKRKG
jgi:excisionase family DNA binding protein